MATNSPAPGTIPPGQDGPSQDPQASGQDIQQNPGQIPPQSFPANGGQFGQQNPSRWRSFKRNPCCCMELGQGALIASICLIVNEFIATILYTLNLLVDGFKLPHMDAKNNAAKIFTIVGISMSVIFLVFAIITTYGVIKKSLPILMVSVHGCFAAFIVLNAINFASATYGSTDKGLGPDLGLVAAILVHLLVIFYLLYVLQAYLKLLRAEGLVQAMGGGGGGQFPVAPYPPKLYYQPSVPTVGYSQTSLNPGSDQQSGPPTLQ